MPEDRGDLLVAAAEVGEPCRGRLAETMRRHVGTAGRVALLAKPIAEADGDIGLPWCVTRKLKWPLGAASMLSRNFGCTGITGGGLVLPW